MTNEIIFDDEELAAASHWYGGQGSMLYAIVSTGALRRGTNRPRADEGGLMTDEEWIVDLAERLADEAEASAKEAAKQAKKAKGDEKKELIADREGLLSIAYKARQFVRDAARAKKQQVPTRQHATKRQFAKKAPAQLDREIAEALAHRPSRHHSTVKGSEPIYTYTLSAEELEALRTFAKANGRSWKSKLNHAWMTGRYRDYSGTDDYGTLQWIRNRFGPTWLSRFSFERVKTHSVKG